MGKFQEKMMYKFKPRKSFNVNLKRLGRLDSSIIDEVHESVQILLDGGQLPEEFDDHDLHGNLAGYREFHLRDTPHGQHPTDINDILVVYKIEEDDLVLIAVNIGSHSKC